MKLVLRTVLFSLIVIGLAISDASGSDGNVKKNSHTIESKPRSPPSSPITDSSSTSTPKSTIVPEPLPDDDASFESIRTQGKVYVDKTGTLEYLLNRGNKLFFFTRPRRFGKSLLAKMMKTFFRGEQPSFFEGLQISERGNIVHNETIISRILRSLKGHFFGMNNKWVKYPVIYLDLSDVMFSVTGTILKRVNEFETNLNGLLKDIAEEYNVDSARSDFGLSTLIRGLRRKFNLPVIILIDEYDAPVNTALHEEQSRKLAKGIATVLDHLFVRIKANTEFLRFVWVTGVTKLGLPALQSGSNSFTDVTLTKELAAAVGFTKDEITSYFKSHIEVFSNVYERKFKEGKLMEKLVEAYDGYRFSINSETRVFNPVSILGSFRDKQLDNYWQATASLSYIIRRMWKGEYTISAFRKVSHSRQFLFKRRDAIRQQIPLDIFMLLTGYLKIDAYYEKTDTCVLTYANTETEEAICDGFRNYIPTEEKLFEEAEWLEPNLRKAMRNAEIPKVVEILNRIGFPDYHIALNDVVNEKEVTRRLLAVLQTAGLLSQETRQFFFGNSLLGRSTEGDMDITTRSLTINYVIEIKCGMGKKASVLDGIKQLIEYVTKTEKKRTSFNEALDGKDQVYLLTIHFKETYGGKIDEWVFLPYQGGQLRLDKLKASSQQLLDKVKNMVSTMNIDPLYIVN